MPASSSFRIRAVLSSALLTTAAASLPVSSLAAQAPVTLLGTQEFTLKSARNGVEYRVDVWLPPGLDTMTARPSVFYVTDGNLLFPLLVASYEALALGGDLSPLILVGVGYPDTLRGMSPVWQANRTRDYTPTLAKGSARGTSGESAAFLGFLKDELVPFVESRWHADSAARGLGGHSFGGLFSTYALLHEPTLFRRYWIGSPSLWWDEKVAFSWLPPAMARRERPVGRAFLTVGSLESDVMVPPMQQMALKLRAAFPALKVGSQLYPEETHVSVIGGALARALRYLYGDIGRPAVALTASQRAAYVGTWAGTSGRRITIARDAAQLKLSFTNIDGTSTVSAPLFAETPDLLFTRAFMSSIAAERDGSGTIKHLRVTLGAPEEKFERVR